MGCLEKSHPLPRTKEAIRSRREGRDLTSPGVLFSLFSLQKSLKSRYQPGFRYALAPLMGIYFPDKTEVPAGAGTGALDDSPSHRNAARASSADLWAKIRNILRETHRSGIL